MIAMGPSRETKVLHIQSWPSLKAATHLLKLVHLRPERIVQLDPAHFQILRLRPLLIPQMTPFHVTLPRSLLIDLVVNIVILVEIRNETKFRPLKETIFKNCGQLN
jgi:hypothetical protein